MADPGCDFTKALDLEMTDPGPVGVLGNVRSKRFAAVMDDGKCSALYVSEGPGDPAGDDACGERAQEPLSDAAAPPATTFRWRDDGPLA